MAASDPSSQRNLLAGADLESGVARVSAATAASAQPTLGRSLALLGALFGAAALVTLALGSATPPSEELGVHYGPVTPAYGEAQGDKMMTGSAGEAGVHYMIQGAPGQEAPERAKMMPGYREAAEVAQEDLHFLKWLVQAGDVVHVGDPLFTVSKDGHSVVIKASASGQIKELADAGDGKTFSKGSKLVIFGHPSPQLTPPMLFQAFCFAAILSAVAALATCLPGQPDAAYAPVEPEHQVPQGEARTHGLASVPVASRIVRKAPQAAEPPAISPMPLLAADAAAADVPAVEEQKEAASTMPVPAQDSHSEVLLPSKEEKQRKDSAPSLPRIARAALSASQPPADDNVE